MTVYINIGKNIKKSISNHQNSTLSFFSYVKFTVKDYITI